MKKYEQLTLEVARFDSSDVIATSADVTTGGIKLPWTGAGTPATASFGYNESVYELD